MELWAWIERIDGVGGKGEDVGAEERWSDLVNSLSGLFCASLNFIDSGKTTRPLMSFEPEGTLQELQAARKNVTGTSQGELQLLHGMLPHEVVCTENLTPFLKLLPCKGKAGISSLLDGHKVFDANWQTMAVDVRPVCKPGSNECELEIEQTVDMVLDIERSMRPRESPIPRPPPIEDLVCDENKAFNAHDTCYPKPLEGEMEWSLSRIFGRPVKGSCQLGPRDENDAQSLMDIFLQVPAARTVELDSETQLTKFESGNTRAIQLPEAKDVDISLPAQVLPETSESDQKLSLPQPPLHASRQMTGYGAERGAMHTTLHNTHSYPQRIVYLESLPWFLRPYIHTLHVSGGKIENMYYTPLLDRQRGTHLELLIEVPAESTVEITYDFEKAILRYTEYPPDANRGFDIPAAVIRVLPSSNNTHSSSGASGQGAYLRTTSLLLPLPTPDFSMPYNVIILTSTVLALGFGSVFNFLVRRFVLVDKVPVGPLSVLGGRVREGVAKVRQFVKKADGDRVVEGEVDGDGREAEKVVNGRLKEVNGGGSVKKRK